MEAKLQRVPSESEQTQQSKKSPSKKGKKDKKKKRDEPPEEEEEEINQKPDESNQLIENDYGNTPEETKEAPKKKQAKRTDVPPMTRQADISMQSYRSRYSHVSNSAMSSYSAMNKSHMKDKKEIKSVEQFMQDLVGDQFYQLVFLLSLEN